ncbi:hypothetical protein RCL1_008875 [Eukaryota sp. TZLM3-RCL]
MSSPADHSPQLVVPPDPLYETLEQYLQASENSGLSPINDIAYKMYCGQIITSTDAAMFLNLPDTITEPEIVKIVTDTLPVYGYKVHPLKEFIFLPLDKTECLFVTASLYKNLQSYTSSDSVKPKRGSYSCSICGKLGHTKAKCPLRFPELSHESISLNASAPPSHA